MATIAPTKFVNNKLYDGSVRHAVYLESFKAHEARKITQMLAQDVYKPLVSRVKKRMANISTRGFDKQIRATQRLKELEATIKAQLRVGMSNLSKEVIKDLNLLGVSEAEFSKALLKQNIPLDMSFAAPSGQTLRSIVTSRPMEGKLLKDWFKQLSQDASDKVVKGINMGLTLGEGIPKIARRVALAGDLTKRNAIAISRTAVNHVSTQAREMTYAENADVVKGVEWVATLDSRTTMRCISLDGKVFKINDGPRPPAHFQCRSTTVPITKSWKELGIKAKDIPDKARSSMNGYVPAKQTYPQWLKKQPAAFQKDVLGVNRYNMFKNGMPISKMVTKDFHPLTLNQIRKREGLKVSKKFSDMKITFVKVDPEVLSMMEEYNRLDKVSGFHYKASQVKMKKIHGKLARKGYKTNNIGRYDPPAPKSNIIAKPTVSSFAEEQKAWVASLTEAEKNAIQYWSQSVYTVGDIRDFEAGVKGMSALKRSKAKTFLDAMKRAPNRKGTLYRGSGWDGDMKDLNVGKDFNFGASQSASKEFSVAEEFATYAEDSNPVVFEIRSLTGKDISKLVLEEFEDQAEAFIGKNTNFKIISKKFVKDSYFTNSKGGYWKVTLDEIDTKIKSVAKKVTKRTGTLDAVVSKKTPTAKVTDAKMMSEYNQLTKISKNDITYTASQQRMKSLRFKLTNRGLKRNSTGMFSIETATQPKAVVSVVRKTAPSIPAPKVEKDIAKLLAEGKQKNNLHKIRVDLSGLDNATKNDVYEALKLMKKTNPSGFNTIYKIEMKKLPARVAARAELDLGTLALNKDFWMHPDFVTDLYIHSVKGFGAAGTPSGIIYHEYGHFLQHNLPLSIKNKITKVLKSVELDDFKSVSKYATTNTDEAFAETVALFFEGGEIGGPVGEQLLTLAGVL